MSKFKVGDPVTIQLGDAGIRVNARVVSLPEDGIDDLALMHGKVGVQVPSHRMMGMLWLDEEQLEPGVLGAHGLVRS